MAADLNAMTLALLSSQIEEANAIATRVRAASTDGDALIHDIRKDESIDDAEVKKFQEWYEKANASIEKRIAEVNEYIKANLLGKGEEIDVEAETARYNEAKAKVAATRGFVKTLDLSEEETASIPDLKTLRGASASTGGTGDGPKRPRISRALVNGEEVTDTREAKDGTTVEFTNFTVLGTHLSKIAGSKVDPAAIRSTVYELAGTDDLSTVKGQEYVFTHEVGEKSFEITINV